MSTNPMLTRKPSGRPRLSPAELGVDSKGRPRTRRERGAYFKIWRKKNADRVKEYRSNNRERIQEYQRNHYRFTTNLRRAMNKKQKEFQDWCFIQHDVVCNQKYDGRLPYSFHLKRTILQAERFLHLLPEEVRSSAICACAGHDLIEDARVSYNEIVQMIGRPVAEVIFLCTQNKGRDRFERKNDQFYYDLATSEVAVFVKLCDIMANSLYSVLSNSSMLNKQREEWPRIRRILLERCTARFMAMFLYLDKIYTL